MKKSLASTALLALGIAIGFGYARWYFSASKLARSAQKSGYHCPMHPNIRDSRASDCPICGMKLVPDTEQQTTAAIHVPAEKRQWIGVKTGPAEFHAAAAPVRAPGRVAVDETRIVRVQTRFDGWIQDVLADFTGKLVSKGDPLLTLYSPEIVASQQEYLLARRAQETLAHSTLGHASSSARSLLETARSRLIHHWGLTPAALDELDRTGQPKRLQTIYAPAAGFIMARNAYPNQRVTAETELYTLADLSRIWVIADIQEADSARVRAGAPALVKPNLRGTVDYILPQVDPQTRTVKVRIVLDNPGFALKPDNYVDVEFTTAAPPRLAVPEDAVIDTGSRSIVYVDSGDGHYEPREVVTGAWFAGKVEILAGLKRGERVATAGAFLLDSESRMKAPAERQHD